MQISMVLITSNKAEGTYFILLFFSQFIQLAILLIEIMFFSFEDTKTFKNIYLVKFP